MMDMMQFVNKTRNPFKAPLAKGEILTSHHTALPGGKGVISVEAHQAAMKGDKAFRALVEQQKIVVTTISEKSVDVHSEELEDATSPEKPEDLKTAPSAQGAEKDITAKVETKSVETVTVPADGAPAKAPKKRK